MQPLVPAIVDLRDFPYMPLDVVRLRDSRLASHVSGEGFRCAVLLWCAAWHQVPAASLPDDDIQLAQYAGFGRSVREWRKVREESLHGWVKCSDGRLYHPTVAEKAMEAWQQRLQQRYRTECSRIKKAAQRSETTVVYPTFDQWEAHLLATGSEQWRPDNVPNTVPGDIGECPRNVPRDLASKGREGKGREGKEEQEKSSLRSDSSTASPSTDLLGDRPKTTDLNARRAERTAAITEDAIEAYNRILAKPNGKLAKVSKVGRKTRRKQVARMLTEASEICDDQFGDKRITPEFWQSYFEACDGDPWLRGDGPYTGEHADWRPGFEYLTRPTTVVKVFERDTQEAAA
jgi:hypothetical protein